MKHASNDNFSAFLDDPEEDREVEAARERTVHLRVHDGIAMRSLANFFE
jgi:hypothetical protein